MFITREEAEQITEKYYDEILKFCCALTKNSEDSADITQDVFLLFFRKRNSLYATEIRAWLYKTAGNKVHEYFRTQNKEQQVIIPLDEVADIPGDTGAENSLQDEDELFDKAQKKILSLLTESERQLYISLYKEKKKVSTIAEESGVSENAVYTRKSRLRKKITEAVKNLGFFVSVIVFLS